MKKGTTGSIGKIQCLIWTFKFYACTNNSEDGKKGVEFLTLITSIKKYTEKKSYLTKQSLTITEDTSTRNSSCYIQTDMETLIQ